MSEHKQKYFRDKDPTIASSKEVIKNKQPHLKATGKVATSDTIASLEEITSISEDEAEGDQADIDAQVSTHLYG